MFGILLCYHCYCWYLWYLALLSLLLLVSLVSLPPPFSGANVQNEWGHRGKSLRPADQKGNNGGDLMVILIVVVIVIVMAIVMVIVMVKYRKGGSPIRDRPK